MRVSLYAFYFGKALALLCALGLNIYLAGLQLLQ